MSDYNDINVEEIMAEIRANIASRETDYEPISFDNIEIKGVFDMVELENSVSKANSTWDVSTTYLPYTGNFLVKFFKKIVRRTLIIFSYKQNQFNANVTNALLQITDFIRDKDFNGENSLSVKKIEKYFSDHEELEETMNTKIVALEKRIEELEAKLAEKE